jgi:hypothetical protein
LAGPFQLVSHDLALISGVPASGKSTFGRWLEQRHGFAHLDLENRGLDRFGLGLAWQRILRLPPDDVEPFVSALRQLDRPAVLDWGFPPSWLPLVRALHDAGVTAWWFDGDRAAARDTFIQRGTVTIDALDQQMALIVQRWPELATFYGDRMLEVVAPNGNFMTPEDLFARIFPA